MLQHSCGRPAGGGSAPPRAWGSDLGLPPLPGVQVSMRCLFVILVSSHALRSSGLPVCSGRSPLWDVGLARTGPAGQRGGPSLWLRARCWAGLTPPLLRGRGSKRVTRAPGRVLLRRGGPHAARKAPGRGSGPVPQRAAPRGRGRASGEGGGLPTPPHRPGRAGPGRCCQVWPRQASFPPAQSPRIPQAPPPLFSSWLPLCPPGPA